MAHVVFVFCQKKSLVMTMKCKSCGKNTIRLVKGQSVGAWEVIIKSCEKCGYQIEIPCLPGLVDTLVLHQNNWNLIADVDLELNMEDLIKHPQHYNKGSIQPIEIIVDWSLDYMLGNVIKYINRHEHKGTPIQDLEKAARYLEMKIAHLKGNLHEII